MTNYIYSAVTLNGGSEGALDSIDGADLTQSDAAIVFTPTGTYIYTLDDSTGGTESLPNLITPDNNPGNKRWVLVSNRAAESSIVTKTSDYTITLDDDIVIGDCSSGNVALTLPQASTKSSIIIFKKSSSNTLTIACYGAETIEGNATYDITAEYGSFRLVSDGTNTWVIVKG
jgi:hypothetical protein